MRFEYDEFKIIEKSLDKDQMRLSESIMSIGNEYMGMRGNFEEFYSGDSLEGTYVGGVWFPDKTRVGWWKNGYPDYFGKMINSPNFTGIGLQIDGMDLDLNKENLVDYYRELDMKTGLLTRKFTIDRDGAKFEIGVKRFVSIAKKEICAISYTIKSLDKDAKIVFSPSINADVRNEDSNYDEKFWQVIDKSLACDRGYMVSKTIDNPFGVDRFSLAHYMNVKLDGDYKNLETSRLEEDEAISLAYSLDLEKGSEVSLYKTIAVTTSRDYKEEDLVNKAELVLEEAVGQGFDSLLKDHQDLWAKRWKMADVIIKGDVKLQQAIRYNIFQLFSTYYGDDMRLNVGPKGFTGEKYGGATYWDTEAYIVPMYLSVAPQSVTKNLLMYRYKQLDQAYENARKQGLKGALYPMVTFTGIECHNEWEITFEEIHRNGAIAYAIYNYSTYTGDYDYVRDYGLDVLVGISRFWADRVHYNKKKDVYMIHGVTGPNEYENNINNNWYTNTLAAWTLEFTSSMLKKYENRKEDLAVTADELDKWKDIIDKMYYPFDEELGVFVQHDTFLDKDLMKVEDLDPINLPLNKNWSWDRILRSCFIKQADVLQGIYMFSDRYSNIEKKKNYEFYEPMTVHESSLSACIHSILACEIGLGDKAVNMYERTARLDLDNYNSDTDDGLHITSMSGSWLSVVQGFAGMRTAQEVLSFRPIVPKGWEGYSFNINYRDRLINVDVSKEDIVFKLIEGDRLDMKVYSETISLDGEYTVKLKNN